MRPDVAGDGPGDAGDVALHDLPPLELPAEVALGEARAGEDDDAGGVAVEPVHQQRLGEGGAQPGLEAVLLARRLRRDGQQARGLVEHQEVRVLVQEREAGGGVFGHAARFALAGSVEATMLDAQGVAHRAVRPPIRPR